MDFRSVLSLVWYVVSETNLLEIGCFPGVGGCGGIFQNYRTFVKGCFAIPLGQVFAVEAELLTTFLTINFAWKYGWHRIWLESDSSYMVQLLSSHSEMVPWRVHQAWQRCIFQIS
ncbi:hypothetical protein LWI28_013336 [Acer negundo]|uniref:RNase H type-1 domain-containing protein n=1 Tax=Acer negundo TaxID=4023 RepID=A0AAD5I9B0_ACENE|nr:hypothetical protein LWI28_013336 [Acer negundo]